MPSGKKVSLVILDGWGLSPEVQDNAIIQAKTPVIDTLIRSSAPITLQAAGEAVGLPYGEMGNSEVGHINLGSGRVVLSDYSQISQAVLSGSYEKNQTLTRGIQNCLDKKSNFHIIGILTDSAVHGHMDHIIATARIATKAGLNPLIHLITDGRDSSPQAAMKFIPMVEEELRKIGRGRIASIQGRYFAMDRDKRWDRTAAVFQALVEGQGQKAESAIAALDQAYAKNQTDEFALPTLIGEPVLISEKDTLFFTNFRSDRAIQLTKYFIDPTFNIYQRRFIQDLFFISMTEYEHGLGENVMFSVVNLNNPQSNPLTNPLAGVISQAGLKQLHAAESEKFAHVTYFFNAGQEKEFPNEGRLIVDSPKVATYDSKPEMSASTLTDQFIEKWKTTQPDFSVINYANADMVGHTGNLAAAIIAVQEVDAQLGRLLQLLTTNNCDILITGDHGNAEQLKNHETHTIDKEHSINPVPLIYVESGNAEIISQIAASDVNKKTKYASTPPAGLLADVAPTILAILGLNQPPEMTGQNLLL